MFRHDLAAGFALTVCALSASACRQDMHNQPKYKPLAESAFFGDTRSARPPVEGTVARGQLRLDVARFTGRLNGQDVNSFPFSITKNDVLRGEERFNIYCSPCHGRTGDGGGMIVLRGFKRPPSYHIDRLRQAGVGHFVDVMTNGFGAMPSYAASVVPDDRWRIAAYIRVLQLSQNLRVAELSPGDRQGVEAAQ